MKKGRFSEAQIMAILQQQATPKIYNNTAQLKDATMKFELVKKKLKRFNTR
jgi:ATP-binding cassette subfamily F protein 3